MNDQPYIPSAEYHEGYLDGFDSGAQTTAATTVHSLLAMVVSAISGAFAVVVMLAATGHLKP